ncbi:hypothetical protein EIP86_006338 [Pleurotus ostreatoroseus]|nr:hypothetical protein EIP86_006338 [Pleurotus ostreatoroseus]
MSDSPPTIDANIDESNLGGENGGIYVFQWLGSNEKALRHATPEGLKEQQGDLVEALLKVISTQENYPLPGRPVREQVAQCLIHIYTYGETKTLYDTVQTLLKSLVDTKSPLKDAHRV